MPAPFKSLWYLASIGFMLMAIAVGCASQQAAATGMSTMAKAAGARHDEASPDVIESMHQQAQAAVHALEHGDSSVSARLWRQEPACLFPFRRANRVGT